MNLMLMDNLDDILAETVASFHPILATTPTSDVNDSLNENTTIIPSTTSTTVPTTIVSSKPIAPLLPAATRDAFGAGPTTLTEMGVVVATPVCVSPSPSVTRTVRSNTIVEIQTSTTKKSKKKRTINPICPGPAKKRSKAAPSKSVSKPAKDEEEDKAIQERKRQRNRDHARKSRQRKKSLTGSLQKSLEELKLENAKLREQIHAVIGKNKTDTIVQSRLATPTEKFIEQLKNPINTVVDSDALSFLQGLRQKMATISNKPTQIIA